MKDETQTTQMTQPTQTELPFGDEPTLAQLQAENAALKKQIQEQAAHTSFEGHVEEGRGTHAKAAAGGSEARAGIYGRGRAGEC